jgi:membrane protease YdiL (CAAX protease family)
MSARTPGASGFQIAFLIFAVLLLAVPADRYFFSRWQWAAQLEIPVGRAMIFVLTGMLFLAVPALRRIGKDLLALPIPPKRLSELAAITLLDLAAGFATLGAWALWWWVGGGESALAGHVGVPVSDAARLEKALSVGGMVTSLLVGGILAPVIEELVFRGLLYRAWERQWGWFPAAIASSAVFAFMHASIYISQFIAGLLLVCIYRRMGSLRAAIAVHAIFNIAVWYPLIGRFVLPAGRETGAIHVWAPNLVCLAIVIVAVPVYIWMARDAGVSRARAADDPDATILRA